MTKPLRFFAAFKAFIRYEGKILMLRESTAYADGINAGFYDVPGGRLTPGESWQDSLRREVMEECGLAITIGQPFYIQERRHDRGTEDWQIIGMFLDCTTDNDNVILGPDHDHYIWCEPAELLSQRFIPNLKDCIHSYIQTVLPRISQ